jgi:hypothetical protein
MAVYDPSGSGNVHMDKSISGKKQTQPAKKAAKVAKATQKKK